MKKIAFALITLIMIILTAKSAASVEITEIMYNPEGDDYSYEYLELYSAQPTSLNGSHFDGIDLAFPSTFQKEP